MHDQPCKIAWATSTRVPPSVRAPWGGRILRRQCRPATSLVSRLLLHDPSAAAPLRLVLATLSLHDAPHAPPPFVRGPQGRLSPAKQPEDATTARARGLVLSCGGRFVTLRETMHIMQADQGLHYSGCLWLFSENPAAGSDNACQSL